jgi:hypothetical protein
MKLLNKDESSCRKYELDNKERISEFLVDETAKQTTHKDTS